MSIENLQAQIKENNGDLSDKAISIKGIKTKEQVVELIKLLSNKDLQIGSLRIEIDGEISDFFISQFKNMSTNPKIIGLSLPGIKLFHESWKIFFEALPGFKSLKHLNLENSNFDYSNDLRFLGGYLSSNPTLKEINLCNDNKIDDKTFQAGSNATELLGYLRKNTNLVAIKYGHQFDTILSPNLSKEIQQKLESNAFESVNEKKITEAVTKLQDDTLLQKRGDLEKFIIESIDDSLRKGTTAESSIELDVYGMHLSRKKLHLELARFQENFTLAMQDEYFSKSAQVDKVKNFGKYYHSQYLLLDTLDEMYQQELKASPHDKSILHNLREDFLNQWKVIAKVEDVTEKNKKMEQLVEKMVQNCEKAAGEVKDKTSGALIKNVLLILSAIVTIGISLGIYAAVTKQSRAERGSFFFQDNEVSKNRIEEVKKNLDPLRHRP